MNHILKYTKLMHIHSCHTYIHTYDVRFLKMDWAAVVAILYPFWKTQQKAEVNPVSILLRRCFAKNYDTVLHYDEYSNPRRTLWALMEHLATVQKTSVQVPFLTHTHLKVGTCWKAKETFKKYGLLFFFKEIFCCQKWARKKPSRGVFFEEGIIYAHFCEKDTGEVNHTWRFIFISGSLLRYDGTRDKKLKLLRHIVSIQALTRSEAGERFWKKKCPFWVNLFHWISVKEREKN